MVARGGGLGTGMRLVEGLAPPTAGKPPNGPRHGDGAALSAGKRRGQKKEPPPQYVILPNEANVLEFCEMWISLMDSWLEPQVCHFVTWLRFAKIGFVWGSGAPREVHEAGSG